jgi:AcrR family transcriptional regulator
MSEHAGDQRISRTKMMIRDAMTELMVDKGFEGVTVRNLTEKAKINRGTFYLHYKDKYDLLEQCEEEVLTGIVTIVQTIDPKLALSFTSQEEPFPVFVQLFEYFRDNSAFLKVILGPKGDPSFQLKLKEMIKKMIPTILFQTLNKEDLKVPFDFFIAYVAAAHLGVIQHWLDSGMEKSPREMTLILAKMTIFGPGYVAGIKD